MAFIDHVDGDQLRLVLFSGDVGLFSQTISLIDGSTTGRTPVESSTDETFPSFSEIAWRGAKAVVVAYDHLIEVDTDASTVTWSY